MITEKMQEAINRQINAELWSAYLYLSMAMDAESKALEGIANWFFVQWLEEQDHAAIFQKYMNSQGAKVRLRTIAEVQQEWRTPLEMFKDTLSHEKEVTEMINALVRLAMEEGDFATFSRLQWFVDEQVEEEDSAAHQVAEFEKVGNDNSLLHKLDEVLGKRRYSKAGPLE